MKGVLLINMGSPSSQQEMKYFLQNMFKDPAIIPAPRMIRNLLSCLISNTRYKNSWAKYELIGGSPLKASMDYICASLAQELGNAYDVFAASSYTLPNIKNGLEYFEQKGIQDILVLNMYPQSAFSTTGSVNSEIQWLKPKFPKLNIRVIKPFYHHQGFIKWWGILIEESLQKHAFKNPLLVFSAHAIPQQNVSKGDTYVDQIQASAASIANALGLEYKLSFQSKIGKVKWVGPDTKELLKELSPLNRNMLLIPISFINENLETLYDLDKDIIPYAKKELHIQHIERAHLGLAKTELINVFKDLILSEHE